MFHFFIYFCTCGTTLFLGITSFPIFYYAILGEGLLLGFEFSESLDLFDYCNWELFLDKFLF